MADLGREIRFGYVLVPNATDPLLDTAREVERRGLDRIGIQDHPYQRRYVDTWALMGMVLAATSRATVFPDVANLPLRSRAVNGQGWHQPRSAQRRAIRTTRCRRSCTDSRSASSSSGRAAAGPGPSG